MTEYLPAAHALQSDRASLPIVSRYVFDGQFRHVVLDDEPLMTEYLPAAHAMQSDSASLPIVSRYVPGGQSRQFAEALTAVEYFPASQSEHESDPVDTLYFPVTHAVQIPPFGPVDPALQVQLVKPKLPTGELEFDGHARQFLKKCT
jgi:hypothetical protein